MARVLTVVVLVLGVAGCGGSDGTNPGHDASVPDSVTQHKRLFVTATGYQGDFGGLAGGDTICNNTAVAANLGGTWKAWLSDSTTNAIDRIDDVGPWYLLNGKVVFNNKANLATSPIVPIDVSENGNKEEINLSVWTGTGVGGTQICSTSYGCCQDWTSTVTPQGDDAVGQYGYCYETDAGWTNYPGGVGKYCYQRGSFYCIEQ